MFKIQSTILVILYHYDQKYLMQTSLGKKDLFGLIINFIRFQFIMERRCGDAIPSMVAESWVREIFW